MTTRTAYLEEIGGSAKRFDLGPNGSWRIGRGGHNEIILEAPLVSRNHAVIQGMTAGTYYLSDLGSQNGTFANNRPVTVPVQLRESDLIGIGGYTFAFRFVEPQPTAKPNQPEETAVPGKTAVHLLMKNITVLVVDMRGFTEIASEVNPIDLARMMSQYFRECGKVIQERDAWAQKYIGDAIMAVWVHDPDQPPQESLLAAVDALIQIQKIARDLQREFGLSQSVRVAAAINTGLASVGNLGSGSQADFTALGETVIKAFRLERITRDIGCEVALGFEAASVLERIAGKNFLAASAVHLKGFQSECSVYSADIRTLSVYLDAALMDGRLAAV